jgi:hypothetical protein
VATRLWQRHSTIQILSNHHCPPLRSISLFQLAWEAVAGLVPTTFCYIQCIGLFRILLTILSNQYKINVLVHVGPVAQRLEQRTHNPLVLGSNPSGPTNIFRSFNNLQNCF